jgi:hypothetical protein
MPSVYNQGASVLGNEEENYANVRRQLVSREIKRVCFEFVADLMAMSAMFYLMEVGVAIESTTHSEEAVQVCSSEKIE